MKIRSLLALLLLLPLLAVARPVHGHSHHHGEAPQAQTSQPDSNRSKWFKEVREKKHQFLIKELELKKEQQKQFFEIYDSMDDELRQVQRDTRKMEKRVQEAGDDASDLDYEKATDALYEAKQKEGAIELKYKEEFKKVLTPKQLFKLKGAERKFTKDLMEHHQKIKKAPKK